MTGERESANRKYHGNLNYEGQYRESELSTLGFYLKGKPDTEGWRNIFAENDAVPIAHNGRIFPEWAVLDARELFKEEPQTVIELLEKQVLSQADIPPLQNEQN